MHDRNCGAVTHIIGIRLEGEPEHGHYFAAYVPADRLNDFPAHCAFALLIRLDDRFDNGLWGFEVLSGLEQCERVLGKAATAITGAGIEEFAADPLVEAHAASHLLHISARPFAEIGDFVDECDLGRQKSIAGIFGEFGRTTVHFEDRRFVQA